MGYDERMFFAAMRRSSGRIFVLFLLACIAAGCGLREGRESSLSVFPGESENDMLDISIPKPFRDYIARLECRRLGGHIPEVFFSRIEKDLFHIRLSYDLDTEVVQDDWQFLIVPSFDPDFHWAPHLTPREGLVMDQHCFRSPALITKSDNRLAAVVPDLDLMLEGTPVRWYMDLDAPENRMILGMGDSEVVEGQFYSKSAGARYPAAPVEFGFYIHLSSDREDLRNPWRTILAFLWRKWGGALYESGLPLAPDLEPYVNHTYNWAFNTWKDSVWQEFEWNGIKVGAPVFIVNVTQSPNFPGKVSEREFRSIWNQAWFSSLRSASGLFRYARRTNDEGLRRKALLTKELALSAPVKSGFFDTVIATEMEWIEEDGERLNRSRGWETAFWGNSDRNPVNRPPGQTRNRDARAAPYHVLDMSWTSLLMLRWYEELEQDPRLLKFAQSYADSLLPLQDEKGFFPAWLEKSTLRPLGIIDQSPESSMSATFLLKLAEITGETRYRNAGIRAVAAVAGEIVPVGRWEDFETYWSSSSYGSGDLIGKKILRNDMYKQCNFSMFWTAESLWEAYRTTGERDWLLTGQRVLDEMLMTQASWQPPYMYVPVLGGFGVMNADGEWLDSRESLFAEIIVRYGLELKIEEYIQRGLAALRSSFVMMYCPENPETRIQWEKKHPFFGPEDYGFTMENYGHGGRTDPEGGGMGVFTIYDWGNGAAAEAYNRMRDHLGDDFILGRK